SGLEYADNFDISRLGAVVTKGVAMTPWKGNPTPRVCETPSGMLNAIGLQNAGVETFIQEDLSFLRGVDTRVIVNVCGHSIPEYCQVVERLDEEEGIDAYEINVSCPNVKEGGIAFGTDPSALLAVTQEVRRHTRRPMIIKLSPNVTDIASLAKVAEEGGADAVSLINTLLGMKIDIYRRKPFLANTTGGLSGPAIRPVAVRMVYQVAHAVKIPVIGMGGITSGADAIEFLMAGATAVSVGTAIFHDPAAPLHVAEEIEEFLQQQGIKDIREIIGVA
ncbi:MAG: dihydroorotate dehydrogenase, partial [Blautia sp.]|nr:dihydroorotate dehydrogenase [Blautia sp.]